MTITRVAGKVGIPGLYVTGDPGGVDEKARIGQLDIRIGLGGQSPSRSSPVSAQLCVTIAS